MCERIKSKDGVDMICNRCDSRGLGTMRVFDEAFVRFLTVDVLTILELSMCHICSILDAIVGVLAVLEHFLFGWR